MSTDKPKVILVKTSTSNLGSIIAAFERCGTTPVISTDPKDIQTADHVVVPGVGTVGQAMAVINETKVNKVLCERIRKGLPCLFVCVGTQLLCNDSVENPGVQGLGIIDTTVQRFPDTVVVPQQGWNKVYVEGKSNYIDEDGYAFFSNSFCLRHKPKDWTVTMCTHAGPFIACMEYGAILACQFHPELSGTFGYSALRNWLKKSKSLVKPYTIRGGEDIIIAKDDASSNLARRVVPCLDVRNGVVVKGIKFQGLKEAGDPAEQAAKYERDGADELVMLDVSATPEGRKTSLETIRIIRGQLSIPLTVGGGIRTVDNARAILEAGADKVSINTAAVRNPQILTDLAHQFGRQCTVLAIDASSCGEGKWEVVVKSGKERTGMDVIEWAKSAVEKGAGEILLTSWDRDGTKQGYDIELLNAMRKAVSVPIVASGGVGNPKDLVDGLKAGADAVLAASIFHYGEYTPNQVKDILQKTHKIRHVNK